MAWNEPGKGKDPWGDGNRNKGGGNGGGPPDLDQIWKRFRERLGNKRGGGNGGSSGGSGGGIGGGMFAALIPIILVIWLATGLYIVQPGEKGVVLRLGAYTYTAAPGWHWHPPYPIGQVLKVDTQQVRRASNRAVMLTKDENFVDVEVSVQYRVSDAMNYLFQLKDPDNTVQQVLRSAVRGIVGTSEMNQVIQEGVRVNQLENQALSNVDLKQNSKQANKQSGLKDINKNLAGQIKKKLSEYPQITDRSRAKLPDNVRRIMQYTLNNYSAGIQLLAVNVQYAQPPEQVQAAFQEAIKAREEEQRAKNIARAYARDIVARAQGDKAQIITQSKAYKQRKIDRAEGQASRFSNLQAQYENAPSVTRERLYLETMGDVLSASHVILNDNASNSMTYLPLGKILEKSTGSGQSNGQSSSNTSGSGSSSMTLPNPSNSTSSGSSSSTGVGSGSNGNNLRSRSRNS